MDLTLSILALLLGVSIVYVTATVVFNYVTTLINNKVIKSVFAGLLILPVVTALPNFLVSLSAVFRGVPDIVYLSNLGNNIGNLTLVAAVAALVGNYTFRSPKIKSNWFSSSPSAHIVTDPLLIKRDAVFLLGSAFIAYALMLDGLISRLDGAILVIIFLFHVLLYVRKDNAQQESDRSSVSTAVVLKIFLLLVTAGLFMFVGAELVIFSVTELVALTTLSGNFLGAVVVSTATILPNASVIIYAARQKKHNLSYANLLGDSMASVPLTLGVIALIAEIPISGDAQVLMNYFLFANIAFFVMVFTDIFRLKLVGSFDIKNEESVFLLAVYVLVVSLLL